MKIVMIGAGNLATHLSEAFINAGFQIVQVFSRSDISARLLANRIKAPYTTDIKSIVIDASLYVISVNDDAISQLIEYLPVTKQLVIHTAGSVPMDIFSGKLDNYGVLYPLQTFSKSRLVNFKEIPIFLEANNNDNLTALHEIAKSISEKVYVANSRNRMFLHLAAVFCCNFVNYLYHISSDIVKQDGFNFNILAPLILETAQKAVESEDPSKVQTGPAIRNDQKTMEKHLNLLDSHNSWHDLYAFLSKSIRTDQP